jgi:hypothetical protein
MKYIKKIIINDNQFNNFCKKNKNIIIENIEINNIEKVNFFIEENKDFIIKSKIENLSYLLLSNNTKDELSINDIQKLEDIIKNNTKYSYDYAEKIIRGLFKKGEDSISKDPFISFNYASNIIEGPWEKGEDSISEIPEISYRYASELIKGVWKKGHQAISRKPLMAARYAIFLNKRWKDIPGIDKKTAHFVETSIIKNHSTFSQYVEHFFNGQRWIEAEKYLLKNYIDSKSIVLYAQKIIKGRWTEGERVLLSMSINDDIKLAYELYLYASNVIKGPWREAEHIIFQDPEVAVDYASNITKEKLPKEIEDEVANYRDVSIAIDYAVDVYKKRWPEYERNLLKIKDELQELLDRMGDVDDEDYPEDIAFVHIEPIIDQYKKEVIKGDWSEAEIIR